MKLGQHWWRLFKTCDSKNDAENILNQLAIKPETTAAIVDFGKTVRLKVEFMKILDNFQILDDDIVLSKNTFENKLDIPLKVITKAIYEKQNIVPSQNQWGFHLEISGKNQTSSNIEDFIVEIAIPKGLLSNNANEYIEDKTKSSISHRVFELSNRNKSDKLKLLPGRLEKFGVLNCLIFKHNIALKDDVLKSSIAFNVYAENIKAQYFEIPVKDINPYQLLSVNPETLEFNKKYELGVFTN